MNRGTIVKVIVVVAIIGALIVGVSMMNKTTAKPAGAGAGDSAAT